MVPKVLELEEGAASGVGVPVHVGQTPIGQERLIRRWPGKVVAAEFASLRARPPCPSPLSMSVPLARQARLAQSLSVARRPVLRCQRFTALASQTRHEPGPQDTAPVAGPSRADASTVSASSGEPATHDFGNAQEPFARVQSYLAAVNESGIEPTLRDLDACKPAERPPINSPKYVTQYNDLINTLCRSFTKHQLRKFLVEALGPSKHCATSRRKSEYAESILDQLWKWPTLGEVERARRDKTEVTAKGASCSQHACASWLIEEER